MSIEPLSPRGQEIIGKTIEAFYREGPLYEQEKKRTREDYWYEAATEKMQRIIKKGTLTQISERNKKLRRKKK